MRKKALSDTVRLSSLAEHAGAELRGDPALGIAEVCPSDEPSASALTFIAGPVNEGILNRLKESGVKATFVSRKALQNSKIDTVEGIALLVVEDAFLGMISVLPFFYEDTLLSAGVSPQAVVDPSAQIGENVSVAPFCFVGADVVLEDGVRLYPHVCIYPGVRIGKNTIVHAGAVIREDCRVGAGAVIQNGAVLGADGFGYRPDPEKGLVSFPQVGTLSLADRVDIGANACVDRGALGDTEVGEGTKIDNLVQVGHNTKIGKHSILCGQVGVSGSCTIGDQVTLAGGVGVADHVQLPSKSRFGARSGVTGSVSEPGDYAGWPVSKASDWRRQAALLRSLPELVKEFRRGLKRIAALEKQGDK